MKLTSIDRKFLLARSGTALVALVAFVTIAGSGCDEGNLGDRCNPDLSHDECDDGLFCSGLGTSYPLPGACVENYCCPADPAASSNPYCNGLGCPAEDAGEDAGQSDAPADSPDAGPG